MLEKGYWIAGIILAIVTIIGIFIRQQSNNTSESHQSAKVSGKNNTINQSSNIQDKNS